MPWKYACPDGCLIGLQVAATEVSCKHGRRLKAVEIDQDEYRKLFTTKIRPRKKVAG
jgi:hypothetical protein